jgi:cobalamin-dependent methionine synthase I
VQRVVRQVDAPLMLDSTQIATIEAGLKHAGGQVHHQLARTSRMARRSSTQMCRLAKTYGAALVIGSIDEDKEAAMARTADRKLAIARGHAHGRPKCTGWTPRHLLRSAGAADLDGHGERPAQRAGDDRGHAADRGEPRECQIVVRACRT